MADTVISSNMNLPVPVPTVDPGPQWATDLNDCLSLIDAHDHSTGKGVQITSDGLNITSDLSIGSANLLSAKSVRFYVNGSPLAGASDLGCIYISGVDLYYNDGSGNQVRITQSGSVSGATGTITGLPSGTASAAFSAVSGTFQFLQATSTGANMDSGTLIVRYPGSYPSPSGNYIAIQAPSSLSSGYALTLPALPAQTNVVTLGTSGTISSTTWNDVAANRTRATGTTVAAGGVGISASSGAFTTGNGTLTDITNLSVTITTSGRPVRVELVPDGTSSVSVLSSTGGAGTTTNATYSLVRGSTVIALATVGCKATGATAVIANTPPNALAVVDAVSAGTYTYKAQARVDDGTFALCSYAKLIVYEL